MFFAQSSSYGYSPNVHRDESELCCVRHGKGFGEFMRRQEWSAIVVTNQRGLNSGTCLEKRLFAGEARDMWYKVLHRRGWLIRRYAKGALFAEM